jgi:hypothetical protein
MSCSLEEDLRVVTETLAGLSKHPEGWGPEIRQYQRERNRLLHVLNKTSLEHGPTRIKHSSTDYAGPKPTLEEIHRVCSLPHCQGEHHRFISSCHLGVLVQCHNSCNQAFYVRTKYLKRKRRLGKRCYQFFKKKGWR